MKGDEENLENECEDKKMRDMEQGQETTGVNNGGGVSSTTMDKDSNEEKADESMSDNENGEDYNEEDRYTEEEDSKPIVIQQEYKIQVKFEAKLLGMKVAKENNKLWVVKINTDTLKRKIQVKDIISVINGERVGDDLTILQSPQRPMYIEFTRLLSTK